MARWLIAPAAALLLVAWSAQAQELAYVAGSVVDKSFAPVVDAKVTLTELGRGTVYNVLTDRAGLFIFDGLRPGDYSIEAAKPGFDIVRIPKLDIAGRDRRSIQLALKTLSPTPTIVNVENETEVRTADSAAELVMGRSFLDALPVNQRGELEPLRLAPGVTAPLAGDGGLMDIHANGMRSGMNNYTVDGVRDNISLALPGTGTLPGDALFSPTPLDAMRALSVETAAYTPGLGQTGGAQVDVTTFSGTRNLHGSAYGYFRNTDFSANDYFANAAGLKRGESKEQRYGGLLGGALGSKTFFFLAYEQLQLDSPQVLVNIVPDAASRAAAIASQQPYLNAFPLPNGQEVSDGAALFNAVVADPSHTKAGSARLDRTVTGNQSAFLRFSYYDTKGQSRGSEMTAANILTNTSIKSETFTAGWMSTLSAGRQNDLRVNYSTATVTNSSSQDSFGGATPLPAQVFPAGYGPANGDFSLTVMGATGYNFGAPPQYKQTQADVAESFTIPAGNHRYRFGGGLYAVLPTYNRAPYSESYVFNGVGAEYSGGLLNGNPTNALINLNLAQVKPRYWNLSFFFEDYWKASPRLSISYGFRYDLAPAPENRGGPRPIGVDGNGYLTQNLPLYNTKWDLIQPRVGFAYELDQTSGKEWILRGGIGLYYDMSLGNTLLAFSGPPYSSSVVLSLPQFPLISSLLKPVPIGTQPYGIVYGTDNNLTPARITQYSFTVEHSLGGNQVVSAGWVGTQGSNLTEMQSQTTFNHQYNMLSQVENGLNSKYNALQVRYRRRFAKSVQILADWTWSHSVDSASNDSPQPGAYASFAGEDQGASDFDVRHLFRAGGSYRIPSAPIGFLQPLTKDWYIDFSWVTRTALPYNLLLQSAQNTSAGDSCGTFGNAYCSDGLYSLIRPDLTGLPLFVAAPGVVGGRVFNPPAFLAPTFLGSGLMGRNSLRGFDMTELDVAVRRQIELSDRLRLNVSVEAFNVLNHANFANLSPYEGAYLASPNLGVPTQSLSQSIPGMATIYGPGGPRNLEFSMRLSF